MTNNKQSSIDWLAEQLKKDINLRLRGFDIDKALKQAKGMHKEECIKYYVDSIDYGDMGQHIRESLIQIAEKIYNETFG